MPEKAEELDGANDPRSFWHSEVKRLREKRGWLQSRLGKEINVSEDYVSRLERGVRPPTHELSIRLDQVFDTDGHFVRLFELAKKSIGAIPDFFAWVAEMEKSAQRIEEYSPTLVPGLLQTAGYAREVFKAVWPYHSPEKIQELVDARLERAGILSVHGGPEVWVILEEALLHARLPVGVMADQLAHIVELIEGRKIVLQVLTQDIGMHALKTGQLRIMTLEDGAQIAYTEGPYSGSVLDTAEEVAACRRSYDLVRATALPQADSLARVKAALEEHKKHDQ
ncbi:helix-turn-helix transcriptional regulator [Streptomyces sp. NPDC050617]|uniref:helix-turn-helix domain-containing protein n=1 Tax=Streptomyces sp. NPDC050617 TaxID=3154628 RepID=UPI003438504C